MSVTCMYDDAERSEVRVCGRSLSGIAGSNPDRGMHVCSDPCVLYDRGLWVQPTVVCHCV